MDGGRLRRRRPWPSLMFSSIVFLTTLILCFTFSICSCVFSTFSPLDTVGHGGSEIPGGVYSLGPLRSDNRHWTSTATVKGLCSLQLDFTPMQSSAVPSNHRLSCYGRDLFSTDFTELHCRLLQWIKAVDPRKSWTYLLSVSNRRALSDRLIDVTFVLIRRFHRVLSPLEAFKSLNAHIVYLPWRFDSFLLMFLFRNKAIATICTLLLAYIFMVVMQTLSSDTSLALNFTVWESFLEPVVSDFPLRLRPEAAQRCQVLTLQSLLCLNGGLFGNDVPPNPKVSFMLLGFCSPLYFDIAWVLLIRNGLGPGIYSLLANIYRLLDWEPYVNLASVSVLSFPVRESTSLSGLVQSTLLPVRIISVQRSLSCLESFTTALSRALIGLLKAAPVWSTSVKCEIAYVEHLDPIEDNLGVHHRRPMCFGVLSFYLSCTFVARLSSLCLSYGLKTPLKWTF